MGGCYEGSVQIRKNPSAGTLVLKQIRDSTGPSSSTSIDDMNDDALSEIFLRLPVDCVHCCKCVAKRWLSVISCSYFVRRYVQRRNRSPSLHHDCLMLMFFRSYHVVVSEGKCSPTINLFDFNLSFLPVLQNQRSQFQNIILQISNGLILCQAIHPDPSPNQQFVCNPLTKRWLELPPAPWPGGVICAWRVGFMCHYASDNFDKVTASIFVIDYEKDAAATTFGVWMFSTETGCWVHYEVTCPADLQSYWWDDTTPVSVCGDHMFWYAGPCIVVYNPSKNLYRCTYALLPSILAHRVSFVSQLAMSSQWEFRLVGDTGKYRETQQWVWTYTNGNLQQPDFLSEYTVLNGFSTGYLPGDDIYTMNPITKTISVFRRGYPVVEILSSEKMNYFTNGELLYAMTPWPTPIPQLPAADKN